MRWLGALLLVMFSSLARAQSPDATFGDMRPETRAHYESGKAHFLEKNYKAAAEELRIAYSIEPRQEILFAWAQSERLRGDCTTAVPLYEKYLAQSPEREHSEIARSQLAQCKEVAVRPWYTDRVGHAFTGGGIVLIGVGVAVLVSAISTNDDRQKAPNVDAFSSGFDDANNQATAAVILLGAGSALVGVGIYHYLSRGKRKPDVEGRRASVAPWMTQGAGGLWVAGRF